MSFALFFDLFTMMFRDPRGASARVLALNWPARAVWDALALITVCGIISLKIVQTLSAQNNQMMVMGFDVDPAIGMGLGQTFVLILGAWLIARVGRAFGGQGVFFGALTLVTWLQATLLTLQFLQIVLMLALPPLAFMVSLATLFLILWWFTAIIAELHGFERMAPVLLGLFIGAAVLLTTLSIVLGLLGFTIQFGVAQS